MPGASVSFFPIPGAGTTEGTANFTIPVDEFAWVSMSVAAVATGDVGNTTNDAGHANNSTDGKASGMWLDDGDTVSVTLANASASTAAANTRITGTSTADFEVNSTAVLQAEATVSVRTGTAAGQGATISGTTDARYGISRFDK